MSRSRQRTVIVRQTHPFVSWMLDAIVRRAARCGIFVPILKTSAYSIFYIQTSPRGDVLRITGHFQHRVRHAHIGAAADEILKRAINAMKRKMPVPRRWHLANTSTYYHMHIEQNDPRNIHHVLRHAITWTRERQKSTLHECDTIVIRSTKRNLFSSRQRIC